VSNFFPVFSFLALTWSLSAEEQFYLIAPAALQHLPRLFPWLLLPAAYLFLASLTLGAWPQWQLPAFFRSTSYSPILLGVAAAHALDHPGAHRWILRVLGRRWSAPLVGILVLVALNNPVQDRAGWPRVLVHWAMVGLVVSCVVTESHALRWLLRLWPLRRIGAVSYGIYLYHFIVYWPANWLLSRTAIVGQGATHHLLLFAGVAIGTWGLAEFSYATFERRFLALKARFQRQRGGNAPARAAAHPR
jgi:peptidoglycan/LPS O-acetylase OafA/YrhL